MTTSNKQTICHCLDSTDLVDLFDGRVPYVEVPTPNVPGVRFITIKLCEIPF